jgi:uncharacterized SAM-binding protein YcdF (DUF218 family)
MSTRWPAHVKRTESTAAEGSVFRLFRFLRIAVGLGALLVAWIVATAFLFVWPQTDPPGHANAVVVLAGGRNWRLDPALKLVRDGVAPVLVISGVGFDRRWRKARFLCSHPHRGGFRVLCPNPDPYSTRGEARMIEGLARRYGWRKVDVVTSRYHVFRAGMLIRRCYHGRLAMIGASYPWQTAPLEYLAEWAKLTVQATVIRGC